MRGLLTHEKMARGKHYLKSAAECTSKAVVSLELSEKNINTPKQAVKLDAIGVETVRRLEGYQASKVYSTDPPAAGRFVSSAGALLVAMLNLVEKASSHSLDNSSDGVALIAEEDLRTEAAKISDEPFLAKDAPGFCQAWWRLEVLIKRDLIKRRSLNKQNVYQLLPAGRDVAQRLHARSMGVTVGSSNQSPPKRARKRKTESTDGASLAKNKILKDKVSASKEKLHPSLPAKTVTSTATSAVPSSSHNNSNVTDALYSSDSGLDGVVLLVDTQECGGDRGGLGELCEMIEQTGTVYRTRKLPLADYSWIWRVEGQERNLPILLERKRADDVAFSLKEGRFWSQINKMVNWKKGFTDKGIPARVQYVIEGKPEKFVAQCQDGCQGIGRCRNPTLPQVKRVLQDLQQHPELEVMQFESVLDTAHHLAKITSSLKRRAEQGEFDALVVAELVPAAMQQTPSLKVEPVVIADDSSGDSCQIQTESSAKSRARQQPQNKSTASHKTSPINELDTASLNLTDGQDHHFKERSNSSKTLSKNTNFANRSTDSDNLIVDEEDELPPLHLPRSRELGNPKSSAGLIQSHCASDPKSKPDLCDTVSVNRKINTPSPRGRVYLMKRAAAKNSLNSSLQSKATVNLVGNRQAESRTGRQAESWDKNRQTDSKVGREAVGGDRNRQAGCVLQAEAFGVRNATCLPNEETCHFGSKRNPCTAEFVSRVDLSPCSLEHSDTNRRKDLDGSKTEKSNVEKLQCVKSSFSRMDTRCPHVIVGTDSPDGHIDTDYSHETFDDCAHGNVEMNESHVTFSHFDHEDCNDDENSASFAKPARKHHTSCTSLKIGADFASLAQHTAKKTCTDLYDSIEERGGGSDAEIPSLKCSPKIENSILQGREGHTESWDIDRSDSDSLPDIDLPGPRVKGRWQIDFDSFTSDSSPSTSKTHMVGYGPLASKCARSPPTNKSVKHDPVTSSETEFDPLSSKSASCLQAGSTLGTQRVKSSDVPLSHSSRNSNWTQNSSTGFGHLGFEPDTQKPELSLPEWRPNSPSNLGHLGSEPKAQKASPSSRDTDVQLADKIAQIAAVFPQLKPSAILPVLQECEGCVERTVIALLENPALLSGSGNSAVSSNSKRNFDIADPIVLE